SFALRNPVAWDTLGARASLARQSVRQGHPRNERFIVSAKRFAGAVRVAVLAVAGVAVVAMPGRAATEAEWEAFRADVEAKCLAAAEPLFETAEAIVDPFGSPSYGLAL